MQSHLKCEDLVIAIDITCETCFNGYLVYVLGCIDKQQRIYPIAFALSLNKDQFSCSTFLNSVDLVHKNRCEEEQNPKHVVSDCCDEILNMIREDFPLAVIIHLYFHMHKSVKSDYIKYLKDKTLKKYNVSGHKKM